MIVIDSETGKYEKIKVMGKFEIRDSNGISN